MGLGGLLLASFSEIRVAVTLRAFQPPRKQHSESGLMQVLETLIVFLIEVVVSRCSLESS